MDLKRSFVFCLFLTLVALSCFFGTLHAKTQVSFNHDDSKSYLDPYRGIERPGADFERLILQFVSEASSSLDVGIHEIRLPRIAQALVHKMSEGVRVRIVLENSYSKGLQESLEAYRRGEESDAEIKRLADYLYLADQDQDQEINEYEAMGADAVFILKSSGVPIIDDTFDGSKGSGLMHHKFIVRDGQSVLVTSANFTLSDIHGDLFNSESRGNWNALMMFEDELPIASEFQREFNVLFGSEESDDLLPTHEPRFGIKKPHRQPKFYTLDDGGRVAVQFSPTSKDYPWEESTNGIISRVILQTKQSFHAAFFVFSDQAIAYNLERAWRENRPRMTVVLEPRYAFQYYSEGLDLLGLQMLSPKCVYEAGNSPWVEPLDYVGMARLPDGDLLHHKFAVIDERFVLFGSHNWSEAGNRINDENLLIIDNTKVAQEFLKELKRLHEHTFWGASNWVYDKIMKQEENCGF